MKNIHILVAEDDDNIRNGLIDTLESEGYRVTQAVNGDEALECFVQHPYDLLILDIMMPGHSGYDVCKKVREENKDIPIIMLTAKGEEIDKVVGLQLGADDYVTKPFGVHELLARISAVLRRSQRPGGDQNESSMPRCFQFGENQVDTGQYRLKKGEESLALTDREIQLLCYFHAHPNQVLSRDQLLNAVWGIDYFGTTRTLDQHIAQLRKKIEDDPAHPRVITTVHKVGYRYEAGDRV